MFRRILILVFCLQAGAAIADENSCGMAADAGLYLGAAFSSKGREHTPDEQAHILAQARKQAELGSVAAETALGAMYFIGINTPRDLAQAEIWFLRGANDGSARAQSLLAVLYEHCKHPANYIQALKWARRAADQGNFTGQLATARFYREGKGGIPMDYLQADMWYQILLKKDPSSKGLWVLIKLTEFGLTPADIAKAHELAADWKPKPETLPLTHALPQPAKAGH